MGIALFTFGRLLAPLRSLRQQLVQAPRPVTAQLAGPRPWRPRAAANCGVPPRRPLRVVRVIEPSRAAAGAGRMFISGRMADVCAELDRLAALEAAAG